MLVGSERTYLVDGCEAGIRADGRGCLDWRPVSVETNIIVSASGSARVRLGATDVIVGVKADIGTPDPQRPDSGRIVFSAECSACAGPALQGRGSEALSAALTQLLDRTYRTDCNGLEMSKLCIMAAKKCWVLHVDALIVGADGSLADAASLAVKAALADTHIPQVSVVEAEGDHGDDPELDIDEDPDNVMRLDVAGLPLLVTVGQVGASSLTDLTAAEEACSSVSVQAAVSGSGALSGLSKQGHGAISPDTLLAMMQHAKGCGPALSRELASVLQDAMET